MERHKVVGRSYGAKPKRMEGKKEEKLIDFKKGGFYEEIVVCSQGGFEGGFKPYNMCILKKAKCVFLERGDACNLGLAVFECEEKIPLTWREFIEY